MFTVCMPDRCGAFFHDVVAAKTLMSHGHTVTFVFTRRAPAGGMTGQYRGVPFKYYMMAESELQASDIWTTPHYPILGTVRKLNERFQKPLVVTAHFAENINLLESYQQNGKWGEALLYVSKHMKKTIESRISISPTFRRTDVLYPIVQLSDFALPDERQPGTHITLINGNFLKGVDVFLKVADRLKEHSFLGIRAYYRPIPVHNTTNVTWQDYTEDVRSVLVKTRILLVPSITESWSRVAFEAMYNGIPVLYTKPYDDSNFPGGTTQAIAEWVGDAAIACDRTNIDDWTSAIELLDDPDVYQEWSERAKQKARGLGMLQNVDKYEAFLKAFVKEFPSVNGVTRETTSRQGGFIAQRPAPPPMMAAPSPGGRAGFVGGRFSVRR